MKIIVVEPTKKPYITEIDGTLESMQAVVNGLIEAIYIDEEFAIIVNEEGKLMGLPLNRFLAHNNFIDTIHGTFFICYAPIHSESFEGVPRKHMDKYLRKFNSLIIGI